jgi:hypothetical protein
MDRPAASVGEGGGGGCAARWAAAAASPPSPPSSGRTPASASSASVRPDGASGAGNRNRVLAAHTHACRQGVVGGGGWRRIVRTDLSWTGRRRRRCQHGVSWIRCSTCGVCPRGRRRWRCCCWTPLTAGPARRCRCHGTRRCPQTPGLATPMRGRGRHPAPRSPRPDHGTQTRRWCACRVRRRPWRTCALHPHVARRLQRGPATGQPLWVPGGTSAAARGSPAAPFE